MKSEPLECTPVNVVCLHCKKKYSRNVKKMDPEAFSPHGTKSVLSQFWCPKCGQVDAVRYEFYRDKTGDIHAKVKKHVDPIGMAFKHGDEEEN